MTGDLRLSGPDRTTIWMSVAFFFTTRLAATPAMPDEVLLNEAAYAVWQTVKDRGPIDLHEVVELTGIDQAQVSAAATEAANAGYMGVDERDHEELVVSEGADTLVGAGLPEIRATGMLRESGGEVARRQAEFRLSRQGSQAELGRPLPCGRVL